MPAGSTLRIEGYRLGKRIGKGSMGMVYRGHPVTDPRQTVAIKVVGMRARSHEANQRFLREIEAAQLFRHANLVRCHEVGMSNGFPYLVMEYMGGGDLGATGPMDCRRALQIIAACARGTEELARNGWIHRDIKPHNILLTEDGRPKLGDFGLAKSTAPAAGDELTAMNHFVGTPAYLPPEVLAGERADHRCDIYALGASLYHLLTGFPPFGNGSNREILCQALTGRPLVSWRRARRDCPRTVRTIIAGALHPEPARRYASADALARDCERAAAGRVAQGPDGGWATPLRRWLRRKWHRRPGGTVLTGC